MRDTEAVLQRMEKRMGTRAERAILDLPDYPAQLVKLGESMASKSYFSQALRFCRKAIDLGSPEVVAAARRVLNRWTPGYHLPMMNDQRRNAAWDKALRRAIQPGMRVLEIGTGAGMLAMMAARAGADLVTTCEYNHMVAAVAREVIEHNGYADRIRVLARGSLDLRVGVDLEEPADLVFCDNFADNFFSFQPLQSLLDARKRLLKPGAPSLPAAGSVQLGLAHWDSYERRISAKDAAGFDISPGHVFMAEAVSTEIGDLDMHLLSESGQAFRFDFNLCDYALTGSIDLELVATTAGVVNGIAQWIRLELDDQTRLEARPEAGATFFSNPWFYPLTEPLTLAAGDRVCVHAQHEGNSLQVWVH
jgi:SAM-dependent methyltransferase